MHTKSAGAHYSDMSTEQDVVSPAAAVLERRQRRTTSQKRKQVCAATATARSPRRGVRWRVVRGDDDPLSDHGREDEDEDEPVLRGHVRRHAITQAVTVRMRSTTSGASRWLWARRAGRGACVVWARVVARTWSSCLGEEYGGDEDGALDWSAAALQFTEDNFNDNGAEVRSLDHMHAQRAIARSASSATSARRVGHGKFVECMAARRGAWRAVCTEGRHQGACCSLSSAVCALPGVPVYTSYINQA